MHIFGRLFISTSLCFAAAAANAQSISCGTDYIVEAGDSLTKIAQRAYGETSNYTFIYTVNSAVIGPNPGTIRVGQRLSIPCLDSAAPASTANASTIARAQTTDALPAPVGNRPIRVLTATGWAPYMNEDQEQGGLLTEIINLALENADSKPEYQIDFINDPSAHLQPLLTDHAYDIAIGWSQPNCENTSNMADESKFRCNNLDFSDPMYEEITGYYSAGSDPVYNAHDALLGKRVCRPEGYTLAPLEEVGLAEPDITMVYATTAPMCLDYILEGKTDVALVAVDVANGHISTIGAQGDIQLHEKLSYVDVLHAVTAKTNPRNAEIMAAVNSGLTNIKESGVWFSTVRRHMSAFRASTR